MGIRLEGSRKTERDRQHELVSVAEVEDSLGLLYHPHGFSRGNGRCRTRGAEVARRDCCYNAAISSAVRPVYFAMVSTAMPSAFILRKQDNLP